MEAVAEKAGKAQIPGQKVVDVTKGLSKGIDEDTTALESKEEEVNKVEGPIYEELEVNRQDKSEHEEDIESEQMFCKVQLVPSKTHKGLLGTRHVFSITLKESMDDNGRLVMHTYNDFDWLRHKLIKLYPGIFIPPLPPKKDEERQTGLEVFLNRVLKENLLRECKLLKDFFTHDIETIKKIEKQYDDLEKSLKNEKSAREYYGELTLLYVKSFPELFHKFPQTHPNNLGDELGIKDFLKQSHDILLESYSELEEFFHSFEKVSKSLNLLSNSLDTLSNIEIDQDWVSPQNSRIELVPLAQSWNQFTYTDIEKFTMEFRNQVKGEMADIHAMTEAIDELHKVTDQCDTWSDSSWNDTDLSQALVDEGTTKQYWIASAAFAISLTFFKRSFPIFTKYRVSRSNLEIIKFAKESTYSSTKLAEMWSALVSKFA